MSCTWRLNLVAPLIRPSISSKIWNTGIVAAENWKWLVALKCVKPAGVEGDVALVAETWFLRWGRGCSRSQVGAPCHEPRRGVLVLTSLLLDMYNPWSSHRDSLLDRVSHFSLWRKGVIPINFTLPLTMNQNLTFSALFYNGILFQSCNTIGMGKSVSLIEFDGTG